MCECVFYVMFVCLFVSYVQFSRDCSLFFPLEFEILVTLLRVQYVQFYTNSGIKFKSFVDGDVHTLNFVIPTFIIWFFSSPAVFIDGITEKKTRQVFFVVLLAIVKEKEYKVRKNRTIPICLQANSNDLSTVYCVCCVPFFDIRAPFSKSRFLRILSLDK